MPMVDHPVLWETVLRQIPAGAVVIEAHGGTILLRNRAAERLLGLSDQEAASPLPMHSTGMYTIDGKPIPLQESSLFRVLRTGVAVLNEEVVFERADGSRVTVLMDTTPVHDSRGKVIAGVCTFHDVTSRKAVQADLRREREKLKSILDAIPDPVYICSRSYHVEYANPATLAQLGLVNDRLCYQYLHGRDSVCPDCHNDGVISGKIFRHEWTSPATGRTYDVFEAPLHNADGSVSKLRIARDVSARKNAEDDLRKMRDDLENRVQRRTAQLRHTVTALQQEIAERLRSETALRGANELFERVFANVHLLVACMDRDFNFIRVNRTYAESDGRDPVFFVGKNHFQLYPDPENERVFRQVVNTGEPFSVVEKPFVYPDHPDWGTSYWDWSLQPLREADGSVSGLILTLINATERRRTRDALMIAENRYRLIVEQAARGIIMTDSDTVILEVNPAACALVGRPASELVGHRLSELLPPERIPYLQAKVDAVLKGQTVDWDSSFTRPDGTTVHLEGSANLLPDGRALVIMKDVTERKEAEHALAEYQRRLKSMSSELALDEESERRRLALDLHDRIGQALALCKIKLGVLGETLPRGADLGPLNDVRNLIEQTISDTQTMSFELSPPVLELGLAPAAEWLVDDLRSRHRIDIRFHEDHAPVHLDRNLRIVLFRCIQELLRNVVSHSHASYACVTVQGNERLVRVCVEDNGVGFEPESRSDDPAGSSPGFGLFNIRERLAHLGGHALVSSQPGRGTRVILTVPLPAREQPSLDREGAGNEQQNPDR